MIAEDFIEEYNFLRYWIGNKRKCSRMISNDNVNKKVIIKMIYIFKAIINFKIEQICC